MAVPVFTSQPQEDEIDNDGGGAQSFEDAFANGIDAVPQALQQPSMGLDLSEEDDDSLVRAGLAIWSGQTFC